MAGEGTGPVPCHPMPGSFSLAFNVAFGGVFVCGRGSEAGHGGVDGGPNSLPLVPMCRERQGRKGGLGQGCERVEGDRG